MRECIENVKMTVSAEFDTLEVPEKEKQISWRCVLCRG